MDVQTCLDIAMDHRIQLLCTPHALPRKPICNVAYATRIDEITQFVKKHIRPNTWSHHEEKVTRELAQPRGSAQIVVLLLQPANNHPFEQGKLATIASSPSLSALNRAFTVCSRGSISLSDVTVLDSLPHIRPLDRIDVSLRTTLRKLVLRAVRDRKPKVVLCAWKDSTDQASAIPLGDLMSVGVGKVFTRNTFTDVQGRTTIRVNAFHPSYAVNYHPTASILRQLLLLEINQTIWHLNGQWREEAWMTQLRSACQHYATRYQSKLSCSSGHIMLR